MSEAKTGTAKDSGAKDAFVAIPAGGTVFKEGDAGEDMFIIESGQIDIVRKARPDEAVATLGPGDFFGEMAILEDQPRFAGAVAKTEARLLRIERAAFADVLRQNVEIAVRIMRKLAARQRRSEQRLQETLAELSKLKSNVSAVAGTAAREVVKKAEAPAPKAAPAVPAVAPVQKVVLRHASGQVIAFDPARSEFLVGRPDPVTGIQPEINLGALDVGRTLSRRHAKFLHEGGLYFVREEVGTTNGTFVNGERLKTGATVPLKLGDRLRFGSIEVEFAAA